MNKLFLRLNHFLNNFMQFLRRQKYVHIHFCNKKVHVPDIIMEKIISNESHFFWLVCVCVNSSICPLKRFSLEVFVPH